MGRRRSPAQKAQLHAVHTKCCHNQENVPPEYPVPPPPPSEVPLPKKKPRAWRRCEERPAIEAHVKDKSRLDIIQGKLHNAQRRENRARKKKEMLEERLVEGETQMDEAMAELAAARSLNDELQNALTDARRREEEARVAALCEHQAADRARALEAHVFAMEHYTSEQVAVMRTSTIEEWRRAAHEMREVREKSICRVRETEEHCAAVLYKAERRHAEELRDVREQCATYLAARTLDLEGRATSFLSSIREQAVADVRAIEEWAWARLDSSRDSVM